MIRETVPLSSIRNLLHKATISTLRDIADLLNTQTNTETGKQNGEKIKHAGNQRTEENSRKRTK